MKIGVERIECNLGERILRRRTLDDGNFDPGFLQRVQVALGNTRVGEDVLKRRGRSNQRETSFPEFARVADRHDYLRYLDHGAVYSRFQKIRRANSMLNIETVNTEKKDVRVQFVKRLFCDGPDQRKRVFLRLPPLRITSTADP